MAYTDIGEIKSGALAAIVGDFILTIKEVNVVLTACWDRERLYLSFRSEAERLPDDQVSGPSQTMAGQVAATAAWRRFFSRSPVAGKSGSPRSRMITSA
jgi:hypothetical protein